MLQILLHVIIYKDCLTFTHVSNMFLHSKNRIRFENTNNIKSLTQYTRYNYIYWLNIGLLEIKACDWECYFDLFRYCFELRIERMQSLKGDIYKALSICIVHRFLLLQFFLDYFDEWKKKQNSGQKSKQNQKEELWKFVLQILLEFWLRNLFLNKLCFN